MPIRNDHLRDCFGLQYPKKAAKVSVTRASSPFSIIYPAGTGGDSLLAITRPVCFIMPARVPTRSVLTVLILVP